MNYIMRLRIVGAIDVLLGGWLLVINLNTLTSPYRALSVRANQIASMSFAAFLVVAGVIFLSQPGERSADNYKKMWSRIAGAFLVLVGEFMIITTLTYYWPPRLDQGGVPSTILFVLLVSMWAGAVVWGGSLLFDQLRKSK